MCRTLLHKRNILSKFLRTSIHLQREFVQRISWVIFWLLICRNALASSF